MSMSLPVPAVPLGGCSTIYNNTLYSYSADAFQALPLDKGASWEQLPGGVSVTGGVCVQTTSHNASSPAALYIVGGSANASETSYQGLQRYSFEDSTWESISLSSAVTQNRLYHNAIYLNASSSIFIFSGNQDGTKQPSSESFTISTMAPYEVRSFPSFAPPSIEPMLLTWSDSQAAVLGGSDSNTRVMLFKQTTDPLLAWEDSKITLDAPLKTDGSVKAAIVDGDDKSKSLYTFDMTVSPNSVNRMLLVDQNGNPMTNVKAVKSRSSNEVRDITERATLTATDWPPYNSSLAPKATRTKYSIAQDADDRIVISGGNEEDVLCMFKARENSWVNATLLLSKAQVPIGITNTPTSVSTEAPAASSTAAVAAEASSQLSRRLLGIIIGSVAGFVLIVLAIFFCIRRRRKQRVFAEAGHQRRASGIPDEKDPMDFADRGIRFDPTKRYQGHAPQTSTASFSSMAILMGKVSSTQQPALGRRGGSNSSNASSNFNKNYKNTISKPIPQARAVPETYARTERPPVVGGSNAGPTPRPRGSGVNRQGSTRRSSGWNRYWSGGSALNVLGFGNKGASTYGSQSDQDSMYSETAHPTRGTQQSAMVPPLNFGSQKGRLSQVASGSPTIAHQPRNSPLEQGMSGKIERPHSAVSSVSSYGDLRDAYPGVASSINEEHQTWTPFGGESGWNQGERVASSAYTESQYGTPRATMVEGRSGHQGPNQQSTDMSWLNLGDTRH
ncbi:hypothetical protein V499_05260 [Pseudogymnoascus sp. VKM F-103]|uniref:Pre-mRNA splicing factor CLF1 n=1 Tax=Pseudogymnoascus verrucosus TaxID=342668 RepID=A0A1B8G8K6_9PEZI|nr:uncharacterized protein VE01_10093 [Pseudogymnoascus verrucosus]KFY74736.1 hypothetical protein V499_05260 [Pseudogymnoascus sp. VKM F-103]OBT92141.1 hypothetical protein VE01_10093 [Pseudogymnoascus verrucosus]